MIGKGEYYVRCKNCGRLIKVFEAPSQGYCTKCEALFNYDTQDVVFLGITTISSDYHYEWKEEKNLEDELTKYKMAYDILKRIVNNGYVYPEYGVFDSNIDLSEEEEEYVISLIEEENNND